MRYQFAHKAVVEVAAFQSFDCFIGKVERVNLDMAVLSIVRRAKKVISRYAVKLGKRGDILIPCYWILAAVYLFRCFQYSMRT